MFVDPGENGSGRAQIGFELKELGISPVSPDCEDTIIGVSNASTDFFAGLRVFCRGSEKFSCSPCTYVLSWDPYRRRSLKPFLLCLSLHVSLFFE
jgi:hypothetical protein